MWGVCTCDTNRRATRWQNVCLFSLSFLIFWQEMPGQPEFWQHRKLSIYKLTVIIRYTWQLSRRVEHTGARTHTHRLDTGDVPNPYFCTQHLSELGKVQCRVLVTHSIWYKNLERNAWQFATAFWWRSGSSIMAFACQLTLAAAS